MRRQLRKNLLPSTLNLQGKTKTSAAPEKRRKRDYILVLAALLSLLATFLTLVGYGLTFSIEQFNVPHEILFASTLDLIDLSCWMVMYFFDGLNRISLLKEMMDSFIDISWAVPVLFAALFSCALFLKYRSRGPRGKQRDSRWVTWFQVGRDASVLTLALKIGTYSFVAPAVFVVLSVLGAAAIVFSASVLLSAPAIGMKAGERYIREYVVEPEHCAPPRTRLERLGQAPETHAGTKTANCVRIKNERGLCEQGRVVFATTSAILLFDPATGHAFRVPTKDAVIETLARLDAPASCTPPAGKHEILR